MQYDEQYRQLAKRYNRHLEKMEIAPAADLLLEMADILHKEDRYDDELTLLLLSYFFNLSGKGEEIHVKKSTIERIIYMQYVIGITPLDVRYRYSKILDERSGFPGGVTYESSLELLTVFMNPGAFSSMPERYVISGPKI